VVALALAAADVKLDMPELALRYRLLLSPKVVQTVTVVPEVVTLPDPPCTEPLNVRYAESKATHRQFSV
jgi:hypothetical protein